MVGTFQSIEIRVTSLFVVGTESCALQKIGSILKLLSKTVYKDDCVKEAFAKRFLSLVSIWA